MIARSIEVECCGVRMSIIHKIILRTLLFVSASRDVNRECNQGYKLVDYHYSLVLMSNILDILVD